MGCAAGSTQSVTRNIQGTGTNNAVLTVYDFFDGNNHNGIDIGPSWDFGTVGIGTTADHAFRRVAEECRAGREPRWFTDELLETMVDLHQQGWAHSIEVWQDGDLIGGAFGIGVGRALSGDSLFNRRPNIARIAVADMAARFAEAGGTWVQRYHIGIEKPTRRMTSTTATPASVYVEKWL